MKTRVKLKLAGVWIMVGGSLACGRDEKQKPTASNCYDVYYQNLVDHPFYGDCLQLIRERSENQESGGVSPSSPTWPTYPTSPSYPTWPSYPSSPTYPTWPTYPPWPHH